MKSQNTGRVKNKRMIRLRKLSHGKGFGDIAAFYSVRKPERRKRSDLNVFKMLFVWVIQNYQMVSPEKETAFFFSL